MAQQNIYNYGQVDRRLARRIFSVLSATSNVDAKTLQNQKDDEITKQFAMVNVEQSQIFSLVNTVLQLRIVQSQFVHQPQVLQKSLINILQLVVDTQYLTLNVANQAIYYFLIQNFQKLTQLITESNSSYKGNILQLLNLSNNPQQNQNQFYPQIIPMQQLISHDVLTPLYLLIQKQAVQNQLQQLFPTNPEAQLLLFVIQNMFYSTTRNQRFGQEFLVYLAKNQRYKTLFSVLHTTLKFLRIIPEQLLGNYDHYLDNVGSLISAFPVLKFAVSHIAFRASLISVNMFARHNFEVCNFLATNGDLISLQYAAIEQFDDRQNHQIFVHCFDRIVRKDVNFDYIVVEQLLIMCKQFNYDQGIEKLAEQFLENKYFMKGMELYLRIGRTEKVFQIVKAQIIEELSNLCGQMSEHVQIIEGIFMDFENEGLIGDLRLVKNLKIMYEMLKKGSRSGVNGVFQLLYQIITDNDYLNINKGLVCDLAYFEAFNESDKIKARYNVRKTQNQSVYQSHLGGVEDSRKQKQINVIQQQLDFGQEINDIDLFEEVCLAYQRSQQHFRSYQFAPENQSVVGMSSYMLLQKLVQAYDQ